MLLPINTMVICIYHPYWGHSSFHSVAIDALLDIVLHGRSLHSAKQLIICGDFNGLAAYVDTINSLMGTESLFSRPTHGNNQLDFVLVSHPSFYLKARIMAPFGRSDHSVIFCPTVCKATPPKVTKIQFRKKSTAACNNFRTELSTAEFLQDLLHESNVDTCTEIFSKGLRELFCAHFPLRTLRLRSDDKPWIKPSLKLLINERDRAYSQKKTLKYLRLREKTISHIKKLKRDFLHSARYNKKPSSQWNFINKLLNRQKKNSVDCDVNVLKDTFSSVFTRKEASTCASFCLDNLPSIALSFTMHDIVHILRNLKKGSPGPDDLPFWILRDNCEVLAPAFYHLCTLSVKSGIFPACFKRALVTPIPKCPHPTTSDFRPISMLPIASKVLEKLVYRKWFNSVIPKMDPHQFAFVPRIGQGTSVALTFIVHHILSFLDSPGCVRLLMIDYSKAFDRLPHHVILSSLIGFGAPKQLVQWISSYLTNRTQRVKHPTLPCKSDWYEATSGVPQGSILAPLLFSLVIDYLKPKFSNTLIVKFADDVCLLHCLRQSAEDNLAEEFKHVSAWSEENGLRLNATKTKLMHFQTKRTISLPPLIDESTGAAIEVVSSTKLLGLIIDTDFSWNDHLEFTLLRIRRRIGMLYALKEAGATPAILWHVYCAMIRSIASYAFPAWCNISASRFRHFREFERRICKTFNLSPNIAFTEFCNSIAQRLATKSVHKHHPLSFIYDHSASRYSLRLGKSHRKLKCRTSDLGNSFLRFA
jgi:hypothetical protein